MLNMRSTGLMARADSTPVEILWVVWTLDNGITLWVWVKIRYPNNWMVNTKLDIHICGPLGLPFWPTSICSFLLVKGWLLLASSPHDRPRHGTRWFPATVHPVLTQRWSTSNRNQWKRWRSCIQIPSGKLTVSYGKSPSLIGKSTINGPCSIAIWQITRG